MRWTLLMAVAITAAGCADAVAVDGDDDDDDGNYNPCHVRPLHCDGDSLSHFPLGETLVYQLGGWWELHGPSSQDLYTHTLRAKQAALDGHALLTRVSPCTLKISLSNMNLSDWPQDSINNRVETWVRVSGEQVEAVCGRGQVGSLYASHIHALARNLASTVLNSVTELSPLGATVIEGDHLGQCTTQYQLGEVWPGGHEVIKTRDLSDCTSTHTHSTPLSAITSNATWSCHQQYDVITKTSDDQAGRQTLHSLNCQELLSIPGSASAVSSLNLTFIDFFNAYDATQEEEGVLQLLDLEGVAESASPLLERDEQVYNILGDLCTHLETQITAHATMLYPRLLSSLSHLPKEMLVQLYHEVSAGRICPQHQKLRDVFLAALRDSSTPAAAATKCHLMTSRTVEFSHSWSASLRAVKEPTVEALFSCAELLASDQWEGSVLGVSAMAGWAAKATCGHSSSHPCQLNHSQCPQGPLGEKCRVSEAVSAVANHLGGWLSRCSSKEHQHQVVLAMRGLGNVRSYGMDIEARLKTCSATDAGIPLAVRVGAVSALGRGPCSLQIQNWLKWEILNESKEAEFRITAFLALRRCNLEEAEAVATLITQRQSHAQVNSFLSDFVKNNEEIQEGMEPIIPKWNKKLRDARQFSRHLLANLTSLLGLTDTMLEADLIFQNSFLPRSFAFNISSPLLHLVGGSAHGGVRLENLEELLQSIIGPGGLAQEGVGAWLWNLIVKVQELFASVTQEFVDNHREKRSNRYNDVSRILVKARKEIKTELRGWLWGGVAGSDGLFSSFSVDPLDVDWHDQVDGWLEHIFDITYSALVNSDAEVTNGWSVVNEQVRVYGLVGVPMVAWQQAGALATLGASSQVNILDLLTNPAASSLSIGLTPSLGVYQQTGLRLETLHGPVSATTTSQDNAAGDISVTVMIQGGDQVELKVNLPQASVFNSHIIHTFDVPPMFGTDGMNEEDDFKFPKEVDEDTCGTILDVDPDLTSITDDERNLHLIRTASSCNKAFDLALGVKVARSTWIITGQNVVGTRTQHSLSKSSGVDGYQLALSWKNPGSNSVFIDVQFETEDDDDSERQAHPRRAGLVFGLTYSPHVTLRLQLHANEFSLIAEASLVNDPNLKRLEGHLGFLRTRYGFKAELLMVTDGGHVTVKPRLVIAYPGQQEDALLEGYIARYHSDKVSNIAVDLYTDGILKHYIDVAVNGTAEMRRLPVGTTVMTLENFHLSCPVASLGLEAAISLKNDAAECKVKVTWRGEEMVVDGMVEMNEPKYWLNFEVLLPGYPQLDTRLTCLTLALPSQVTNNLTLLVGNEPSMKKFHFTHSTAWHGVSLRDLSVDIITSKRRRLSFRVDNNFNLTSAALGLDWQLDHSLELSDRALENLVTAQLDHTPYAIALSFYDQSQDLLKYHTELELNLGPQWHLSYTDTLEQTEEGKWVGQSSALMPSKRQYTSVSSLTKKSFESGGFLVDARQEVGVREAEGGQSWRIMGEESLIWTASNKSLQVNLIVGEVSIFGVEASLAGHGSSQLDLQLKTWAHDLYECQVLFGSHAVTTDFTFMLLIIPLNREIRSKVAVGHDQCTGGTVDGQVAWGARGNPARTLTLSSALQFPQYSQPLELRGTLSVLGLVWDAKLELLMGELLDNPHRLTFTLLLPDLSRFEVGSQLDITVRENQLALLTGFYFLSPAGKTHNVSVTGNYLKQRHQTNTHLELLIDSPISQEIKFQTIVQKHNRKRGSSLNFSLHTHSEANYWNLIETGATGWWNHSKVEAEAEVRWGNRTLEVEGSGWHREVGGEHLIEINGEVRRPTASTWKQLSSSFSGAFSMAQNPPRLQMLQDLKVVRDGAEVFNSIGEINVSIPQVEGNLTLTHTGTIASRQSYIMEGRFTGREIQVGVEGSVDGVPVRVRMEYEDGEHIQLVASYRSPDHFTLTLTTHLNDFSLGFRRGGGTSYSLNTVGQLLYHGRTTEMTHQLTISPTQTSSIFTLDPLMDRLLTLRMTRTKLGLNYWETDVDLSWGERQFRYHDEIRFPSISEFSVQVMIDAPDLDIQHSQALVETGTENTTGQWIRILLRQRNITKHSARMMFYKHDAGEERVWEAGVQEVVVDSRAYRDMRLYHAFTPLIGGIEVRSNMTLGETPLMAVGMKVTEHMRALLLGLCTTRAECIRLHAYTHAQATLSSRTFTLAIHALNSLFWKDPQDPLIQNSVTLEAQHMPNFMEVSGGLVRVECMEVNCISTSPRGLLHAAFSLTSNTLGLTVNTTERTIALETVVHNSQAEELPVTSLPGGRLTRTVTVESRLWLDQKRNPRGALVWISSMAAYASARSAEKVFHSSLAHPTISKPLVVGGRMLSEPSSTSVRLVLDVFTQPQDSLLLHVALQHHSAQHVLSANLTKSSDPSEPVVSMVAAVLPSPDSGEVRVVLILPGSHTSSPLIHEDHHFTFACRMNTKFSDNILSCKIKTATVEEEAIVGYQQEESNECWLGGMWIALLNRSFSFHHHSCHDPFNSQTAVTKKVGDSKEELALKFGLVNPRVAELDLLGSAGMGVQLYPPFLLHVTAHHTHSLEGWWSHVLLNAHREMSSLTTSAKTVVQAVASDMEKTKILSSVSPSIPASNVARYLRRHTRRLLQESKRDQLILDIVHSAKACVHVTSVILEAGAAYITHNYGPTLRRLQEGVRVWSEAIITNTWAAIVDLSKCVHHFATTTWTTIANFPSMLLNYAMNMPLVEEAVEWTAEQLRLLQESSKFAFIRNAILKTIEFIQLMLSLVYSGDGTIHQSKKNEEIWNLWVPLTECGYSVPEVWHMIIGAPSLTTRTYSLTDALHHWWHLITHPLLLLDYISPPFPAEGTIIGDQNIISVDGRTFSLAPSLDCSRVLLTDTRNGLFTLLAEWSEGQGSPNYTLLVAGETVAIQGDLQVTLNNTAINLPYISNSLVAKRDDRKLSVASLDKQGREVVSMVCWTGVRRACVVGLSGWLHGDTRALLGTFNLDQSNDFMRPSGKVTQSQTVFLNSWELGERCGMGESVQPEPYPSAHTTQLCKRFLLHYTSPVFPCHDTVNIKPYYDTCLRYLASVEVRSGSAEHDTMTSNAGIEYSANATNDSYQFSSELPDFSYNKEDMDVFNKNDTVYEVHLQDVILKLTGQEDVLSSLSSDEGTALCDVAAAYSTVCGRHSVSIPLPLLCEEGVVPNSLEPLSVEPQLDVVVVVSEDTCDSFMYNQLARPLTQVLSRVAGAKNISDIQVAVLGYGSGGGDVVYRTQGASLLTPASQLRITQPPRAQRSQATLLQAMKAISSFPFRPGSVRVALLLRCDARDIPQFTDSLPLEMMRRRLTLFTLTPGTLMFNPSRPTAVRNTIGMDRWRVYNLRLDRPHSSDSWGVRQPASNIAQLALRSGGGVFTVSEVRQDPRARYYMKLFRRVLSKAVVRVVLNTYRHQRRHRRRS